MGLRDQIFKNALYTAEGFDIVLIINDRVF